MTHWQPIDTVPLDGTLVRLAHKDHWGQECLLKWNKKRKRWENFEGDHEYDGTDTTSPYHGYTHWQEYVSPGTKPPTTRAMAKRLREVIVKTSPEKLQLTTVEALAFATAEAMSQYIQQPKD